MNLANVKGITIPEGAVKALSIGGVKVWEKVSAPDFDKYSWEGVIASMDAGTYAADYAIGDCVPLDLGSEGLINMQVAAFDTDDLADGSGKAKISWVAKELLATSHRMNPALVTNADGTYQEGTGDIDGWEKCELRTYLKNTIKPLISEMVGSRIATVTKKQVAFDTTGAKFTQTSEDDVWIPGFKYPGTTDYKLKYDTLFPDGKSMKKCKVGSTTVSDWYLRDAYTCESHWKIGTLGNVSTIVLPNNLSICLCFCTT